MAATRSSAMPSSAVSNSTACLRAQWGWTPQHLTLWDGEDLVAAAPAYLEGKLARRVRVRPRLGARVCAARAGLLPEVVVRGALLARDRPAPARTRSGAAGRTGRDAGRSVRGAAHCRRRTSISMATTRTAAFDAATGCRASTCSTTGATSAAGRASTTTWPPSITSIARTSARSAPRSRVPASTFRVVEGARGQRRRPRGDARLLPADLRRIRQPPSADPGLPASSGRGDAVGAGDLPGPSR